MKSNNQQNKQIIIIIVVTVLLTIASNFYIKRPYVYSAFIQNANPLSNDEILKDSEALQEVLDASTINEQFLKSRLSRLTPTLYQLEIISNVKLDEKIILESLASIKLQWESKFQEEIANLQEYYHKRLESLFPQLQYYSVNSSEDDINADLRCSDIKQEYLFLLLSLDQLEITAKGHLLYLNIYYEHNDQINNRVQEQQLPLIILLCGITLSVALWLYRKEKSNEQ